MASGLAAVACFLVPCFNAFHLLNVLLNLDVAVILNVPCFLLSFVFQTEPVPIFRSYVNTQDLDYCGLGLVRPHHAEFSVNDNVSFSLKLWHRLKLFQVKCMCLAYLASLDYLFYPKWF